MTALLAHFGSSSAIDSFVNQGLAIVLINGESAVYSTHINPFISSFNQ